MQTAINDFKAGNLKQAITRLNEILKKNPNDIDSRSILVEMLCFDSEFERADKQLDLIAHQSPELAMTSSLLRLTLQGAQARADFFNNGVLPEFFDKNEELEMHLSAVVDVKEENYSAAFDSLNKVNAMISPVNMTCNDKEVTEFRDLDDLIGRYIEVIGGNGKYYWVHIEQLEELVFKKPEDRLDLLWRRADIVLKNGMKGEVRVPTCYVDSNDDASKLAKKTEWVELLNDFVRGIGQKTFLAGDEAITIMELERIGVAS